MTRSTKRQISRDGVYWVDVDDILDGTDMGLYRHIRSVDVETDFREAVMSLYHAPFMYKHGAVYGAGLNIVVKPLHAELGEALGAIIADALTAYWKNAGR